MPNQLGLNQQQIEEDAKRVREHMLELQTAAFGHAQTYTTVIIFGGYAGIFGIWAITHEHLSQTTSFWVALLAGISMLTFVLFEIFGMVVRTKELLKVRALIAVDLPPAEFLARRGRLANQSNILVQRIVIPVWVVALIITIGTGVGAAGLLLYSFGSALAAGML